MLPYKIPPSDLEMVHNASAFDHINAQKMDKGRVFRDVLVVRATFTLDEGRLRVAPRQRSIRHADRTVPGRPASRASLEHAGDIHLDKPGADIVVTGTARSPGGREAKRWSCSVTLADRGQALARLALEALGPRSYLPALAGAHSLAAPSPTTAVPIRYELAFGGAYTKKDGKSEVYRENPSGLGFVDVDAVRADEPVLGPQWQLEGAPLTKLSDPAGGLAGFGPVSRSWASRARFAGTYDAAWRERSEREAKDGLVPDYAPDFSHAFFHCAHPSLRTERPLRGDERVLLQGLLADAPELAFELPGFGMIAEVLPRYGSARKERMRLDTVDVDLDTKVVGLVWRLTLDPKERIGSAILYTDDLLEADA